MLKEIKKNIKANINLVKKPVIAIRIGKCGSTTLKNAITESKYKNKITFIHIKKPPIRKFLNYYILIRNPSERVISSFNSRYLNVIEKDCRHMPEFKNEKQILLKYNSIQQLSLSLYNEDNSPNYEAQDDFYNVHHLKENISFYLTDLLEKISAKQIIGVLTQENLNDDIERYFGIKNTLRHSFSSKHVHKDRCILCSRARKNLKRFLYEDYKCIDKLYSMGKIETTIYDMLSR